MCMYVIIERVNITHFAKLSCFFEGRQLLSYKVYLTGQNYSLELIFAKFATAKIAKHINPLKLISNRCLMPENNNGE